MLVGEVNADYLLCGGASLCPALGAVEGRDDLTGVAITAGFSIGFALPARFILSSNIPKSLSFSYDITNHHITLTL